MVFNNCPFELDPRALAERGAYVQGLRVTGQTTNGVAMIPEVKICGLSTPETLDAAVAGGARFAGFNFFPPSPRYVSAAQAAALTARLPDHVGSVGVFVDPIAALLDEVMAHARLGAIQLHGNETPDQAVAIRAKYGVEVWKVLSIRTRADLDQAARYAGAVDRILYDAKTPEGSTLSGGMGVRFDWALLSGFAHPLPWGLAGGLDPTNVAEAIRITGAPLVDVASGVESAPGVKDMDKIAAFLKAAQA